jgi:AbiV family abortive infection protein
MGSPRIGLKQALRLTQMSDAARLSFLAEGLPHLLRSARGYSEAADRLDTGSREADVLNGFAMEEAAKILIILDLVRCPPKRRGQQIDRLLKHFYSHLTRLIYAEAAGWNALDLFELRRYVDQERLAHFVDGPVGEYIFPNTMLHRRESQMYVDIGAYDDGKPFWSFPTANELAFWQPRLPALQTVEALNAAGVFSELGLKIVSEVWAEKEFRVEEPSYAEGPTQRSEAERLVRLMLERLDTAELILYDATSTLPSTLVKRWQLPMYDLDFEIIKVSAEQLEAERNAAYWSEMGTGWEDR